MISKGTLFIISVNLITILLWILAKIYSPLSFDPLLYISQISALIAATLISLNFILAAKLPIIENWFGGLDRVFNNHHRLGKYAFILILLHPTLFILKAIPNWELVKLYLLPSSLPAYTAGVITLYLFVGLLFVSLVVKIPFKYWRVTHDYMGTPIFTLLIHVLLVSSDVSRFLPLKIWIFSLVTIAIVSTFYIKIYLEKMRFEYVVVKIEDLKNIIRVRLRPKDRKLKFQPGQFVFMKFPDSKNLHLYHPFSISSKPEKEYLEFTIKKGGEFTSSLSKLSLDQVAYLKGPYGRFNEVLVKDNSLWIAGGIGITPFLSANERNNNVVMHQIRNSDDDLFKNEIKSKYVVLKSSEDQKVSIGLIGEYLEKYDLKNIVVCGPAKFVKNILKQLKESKLSDTKIYYELFELYSD